MLDGENNIPGGLGVSGLVSQGRMKMKHSLLPIDLDEIIRNEWSSNGPGPEDVEFGALSPARRNSVRTRATALVSDLTEKLGEIGETERPFEGKRGTQPASFRGPAKRP